METSVYEPLSVIVNKTKQNKYLCWFLWHFVSSCIKWIQRQSTCYRRATIKKMEIQFLTGDTYFCLQLFVFLPSPVRLNQTKIKLCECKRLMSGLCFFLLWGRQQGASEWQAVGPLPGLLSRAVPDAVLLVHHLLQQRLVVSVEWCHRDVPHRTKLTTVIQVLVLQTEEVPHKTSAGRQSDTRKDLYCKSLMGLSGAQCSTMSGMICLHHSFTVLVLKVLHGLASAYLSHILPVYEPRRLLRSSDVSPLVFLKRRK